MTTPDPQIVDVEQSIAFQEGGHRGLVDVHGGDDLPYDDMGDEVLNAVRIGRLLDILGTLAEPVAPLRILDAGCGSGSVTRALASFGHQVDGIDSAEASVVACRARARSDGRDQYALSRLDAWAPAYLYDAVISVDVLFHIVEDSDWAASVVNVSSLVRSGGRLVLADDDLAGDHLREPDPAGRARRPLVGLLEEEGLVQGRFVPFEFRYKNAGFHVFDRIA